jgi:hypothetical protein
MFLLLILIAIFVSIVVRILTLPFRYGRTYGRTYYGYDNPYRYGCRRHHRFLGGLLPILALVALDRIFGRRF